MISAARAAAIFILVLATSAMPALRGGAQADSSPDTVEITFWNSIQSSTDPADFQAYLDKYPHGYFADLANNRIRRLTKPATANAPNPDPAPEAAQPTEPKATAMTSISADMMKTRPPASRQPSYRPTAIPIGVVTNNRGLAIRMPVL